MPLDVRPDHLEVVRKILRRNVPDRVVWAFGSRVAGKAKLASDLDLCIVGETPLPYEVSAQLRQDFSDSDIPYTVDIVDWATCSEGFRAIIERDRVTVQE
ncbi:MAG TPA: nucleotidyltransferase domain-containing protein [Gallionella sp.]|nr:nucleotidyltransferase domain-containing protein [Gallionella sp.]